MSEARERPIIFSDEMVRAILAGRKTQTRRVVKPQPSNDSKCPYGQPGDRLWVREAWRPVGFNERPHVVTQSIQYRSDGRVSRFDAPGFEDLPLPMPAKRRKGYRPSIHMPRWASRITLTVTNVRVERVQEISADDAIAEGVEPLPLQDAGDPSAWWRNGDGESYRGPVAAFRSLWGSINAKRPGCSWEENPWVWVVEWDPRKVEVR